MNVVFFSIFALHEIIFGITTRIIHKKDYFKKKKNISYYYYSDNNFVPMELVPLEFTTTCRITDLLKIALLVKGCYDLRLLVSTESTDYKGFLNIQYLFLLVTLYL